MSKINFPTGPNNGDKFTFSGKSWNFNGVAWDKVSADGDVDSIATGTGGYVAFYTPEGVEGSTIGPAAEVLFWDDTNNRLGIGTTGPSQALEVVGGITASGGVVASGATFNGIVKANHLVLQEDGTISVQGDTEAMTLNFGGGILDISSTVVDFEQKIRHRGDPDTYIDFTVDNIEMFAGDNSFLDSNGTRTNVGGVSFANGLVQAHGITVGVGGITFADGTTQRTAFRAGLKYTITHTGLSDLAQPGGVKMASNISGTAIDILAINCVDANGNDIDTICDLFAANGGFVQILKEDGSELMIAAIEADEVSKASVSSDGSGGTLLTITDTSGIEVDTSPSVGDVVYVYVIPNLVSAVQTIGGEQGNIQIETTSGLSMANIANVGYLRVNPHHHFDFQGAEFSQTTNFAQGVTVGEALNVGGITTVLSGITLSSSGITFGDGTGLVTATRTDSYTGQIETAADKTYTLDPKVATARTITGFYIKSASGTVTATLKNGSDTVKAASVSDSSGNQTSLANTSIAADAVLSIVTSSNSSALDVIFNVEYTTTP